MVITMIIIIKLFFSNTLGATLAWEYINERKEASKVRRRAIKSKKSV